MSEPSPYRSGAKAIAAYINRTVHATFNALNRGQIPGAAKHGDTWVLDTRIFDAAHRAASEGVAA